MSIDSCLLRDNSAGGSGGALCFEDGAQLTRGTCTFSWNSANSLGGAIYLASNGIHGISGSTISGSSALHGGGIACYGSSELAQEETLVVFSAMGSALECGGGVSATLTCC